MPACRCRTDWYWQRTKRIVLLNPIVSLHLLYISFGKSYQQHTTQALPTPLWRNDNDANTERNSLWGPKLDYTQLLLPHLRELHGATAPSGWSSSGRTRPQLPPRQVAPDLIALAIRWSFHRDACPAPPRPTLAVAFAQRCKCKPGPCLVPSHLRAGGLVSYVVAPRPHCHCPVCRRARAAGGMWVA
jgi:hypothetical protein